MHCGENKGEESKEGLKRETVCVKKGKEKVKVGQDRCDRDS